MCGRRLPQAGFTLVEILSILLIISVILAIVIPIAKTSFEKMRIHQTQGDIAALESAIEGYKSANGQYPDASPASRVPVSALSTYMKFPPKRVISNIFYDSWNVPYRYARPGTNNTNFADIASAGPDRAIDDSTWQTSTAGTNADNIDNWSQKR